MNTISSATDTIEIDLVDEHIVIHRACGGPEGRWTWRVDLATGQIIADTLNDLLDGLDTDE
ncbi:hypothetical protein ACWDTP_05035 [Mycobacterium sp. NPDC003449]